MQLGNRRPALLSQIEDKIWRSLISIARGEVEVHRGISALLQDLPSALSSELSEQERHWFLGRQENYTMPLVSPTPVEDQHPDKGPVFSPRMSIVDDPTNEGPPGEGNAKASNRGEVANTTIQKLRTQDASMNMDVDQPTLDDGTPVGKVIVSDVFSFAPHTRTHTHTLQLREMQNNGQLAMDVEDPPTLDDGIVSEVPSHHIIAQLHLHEL